MLRLVAVVPAALVYVAPVLREPLNDIGVLLVSLTVHVEGLLESRAEVAIEEDEAMRLVEALLEALVDAAERAKDFPELLVALVQFTHVYIVLVVGVHVRLVGPGIVVFIVVIASAVVARRRIAIRREVALDEHHGAGLWR